MYCLLCNNCESLFQLTDRKRSCHCRATWGRLGRDGHPIWAGPSQLFEAPFDQIRKCAAKYDNVICLYRKDYDQPNEGRTRRMF